GDRRLSRHIAGQGSRRGDGGQLRPRQGTVPNRQRLKARGDGSQARAERADRGHLRPQAGQVEGLVPGPRQRLAPAPETPYFMTLREGERTSPFPPLLLTPCPVV